MYTRKEVDTKVKLFPVTDEPMMPGIASTSMQWLIKKTMGKDLIHRKITKKKNKCCTEFLEDFVREGVKRKIN